MKKKANEIKYNFPFIVACTFESTNSTTHGSIHLIETTNSTTHGHGSIHFIETTNSATHGHGSIHFIETTKIGVNE